MLSAESHLRLLDDIVCSAERLCEGELCCLGQRRKINALCLLYKIYRREDHLMTEYQKHLVAARNIRTSAALGELAAVRLWNVLPPGGFTGGTLGLKSAVNS